MVSRDAAADALMSQLSTAVQAIFEKNRDELGRRVGTLEDAVAAILEGALDDDLRARPSAMPTS